MLLKHYSRGGSAVCHALLPNRTRPAIQKRARKLGIKPPRRRAIPGVGLDLIAQWVGGDRTYPTLAALAMYLGVSHAAVSKRAKAMGHATRPRKRR